MLPALFLFASLITDVRGFIARNDLAGAERTARAFQTQSGSNSEFAAALSWVARGALNAKKYGQAEGYAAETRKLALDLLKTRKLDADPWLPTALGASIEVHAQALAAQGEQGEAITFLREQLALYKATSIHERIRKNLNLLDLEGKPAPRLQAGQWIGAKPPSLASLRGRPVLLFFWAHWCPDCKAQVPVLASALEKYRDQRLTLIAPTKLYGYTAKGEEADAKTEMLYTEKIRQQFYGPLKSMPIPVDDANFQMYGSSTTPTLVLIDRSGIVRLYHPGVIPEQELFVRIQAILKK